MTTTQQQGSDGATGLREDSVTTTHQQVPNGTTDLREDSVERSILIFYETNLLPQPQSEPATATSESGPVELPDYRSLPAKDLPQQPQPATTSESGPATVGGAPAELPANPVVQTTEVAEEKVDATVPQKTSTGVAFLVTPGLEAPRGKLEIEPMSERMKKLSLGKGLEGLVDEGATMKFGADDAVLKHGHSHGFIAAATAAFANHYPMAIRPQHFWLMILQGIAKHVQLNAEKVRKKWVSHEGKKVLKVIRNSFTLGQPGNDWAGVVTGPSDSFAAQIDKNLVEGCAEQLTPTFSGTSTTEHIAQKITVMDVCKSFFSYKMSTCCGFPTITMEGAAADWQLLRKSAEDLVRERCEPSWAEWWLTSLVPLLDKFVEEYAKAEDGKSDKMQVDTGSQGAGDEKFWNSMCKRGGTSGSGARTWFNGWINILFPYIELNKNRYCVPYSASNGYVQEGRNGGRYGMGMYGSNFQTPPPAYSTQGPDCCDFPGGLAQAPVEWMYYNKKVDLKFKAGFVGALQDADGTVRPSLGWMICHAGEEKKEQDPWGRRW